MKSFQQTKIASEKLRRRIHFTFNMIYNGLKDKKKTAIIKLTEKHRKGGIKL